jgi:PIN domain nuclease of toxin-antitoxin system
MRRLLDIHMLITQAMVEDVPIVSADSAFSLYPVQIIWS